MSYLIKLLAIVLCFNSVDAFSQGEGRPQNVFQTPDPRWWDKNFYGIDSTASAVILLDMGNDKAHALTTTFSHQRRIKIQNKNGLQWGNFEFITGSENVVKFRGMVYNMVDGRVAATALDSNSVLTTKLVKKVQSIRVAFPKVSVGSVIEFSYEIETSGFRPSPWNFQSAIPVKWSEYEVAFGDYTPNIIAHIGGSYKPTITEQRKKYKIYLLTNLPPFIPEPEMPDEKYFKSFIYFRGNPVAPYTSANDGKGEEIFIIDQFFRKATLRDTIEMDTEVITEVDLKLEHGDELTGIATIRKYGYGRKKAVSSIKEIGEKSYSADLFKNDNWKIDNTTIPADIDSVFELILIGDLTISNQVQNYDTIVYINPMVMLNEEHNSLKLEARHYPLDFKSRIERTSVVSVELPIDYTVKDLPGDVVMHLPDRSASFLKGTLIKDNKIYVSSTFKISQVLFSPEEYPKLRNFFQQIIQRSSDLIVLKKK